MTRFPFGLPNGWFTVAFSAELAPGAVLRARYFDRELVIFRTESGTAAVLDAHCPHLGAHLGEGGTVVGESIRCPLHGRRFSVDGGCAGADYTKTAGSDLRARAWPVIERNGLVLVWWHAEDREPEYEIPEIVEWNATDWTANYQIRSWRVASHPQEILENNIDWPHYASVHAMAAPEERDHRFEGYLFRWTIGASPHTHIVDGKRDNFLIESLSYGLGLTWLRYRGVYKTLAFTGLTPIDRENTEVRFGVLSKRDGRTNAETEAALCVYLSDQAVAIEHDVRIWENKVFHPHPPLCEEDGPIREFRSWASHFYSGSEATRSA